MKFKIPARIRKVFKELSGYKKETPEKDLLLCYSDLCEEEGWIEVAVALRYCAENQKWPDFYVAVPNDIFPPWTWWWKGSTKRECTRLSDGLLLAIPEGMKEGHAIEEFRHSVTLLSLLRRTGIALLVHSHSS